jgi:hypothetical protein
MASNAKQFSTIGQTSYNYSNGSVNGGVTVTPLNITGSGILEKLYMQWSLWNGSAGAHFDFIFRVIVDGVTVEYPLTITSISYYSHMTYVNDGTAKDSEYGNTWYAGGSGSVMEPIQFKSSLVVQLYTKSYSDGYQTFNPTISWRYRL